MLRFEIVYTEVAYDQLIRLTKREREIIKDLLQLISAYPEMSSEYVVASKSGVEVHFRNARNFLIGYSIDSAVREVRILELEKRPRGKR